jgi:hypothetical protein
MPEFVQQTTDIADEVDAVVQRQLLIFRKEAAHKKGEHLPPQDLLLQMQQTYRSHFHITRPQQQQQQQLQQHEQPNQQQREQQNSDCERTSVFYEADGSPRHRYVRSLPALQVYRLRDVSAAFGHLENLLSWRDAQVRRLCCTCSREGTYRLCERIWETIHVPPEDRNRWGWSSILS